MKILRKHVAVLAAFAVCIAVCLLFCSRKQGFFIDEIYTFGLSNSDYAPYLSSLRGGDMIDQVFTQEEVEEYLTVGADDAFHFGSVYSNASADVHPPLYFWLFHLVSSLFPQASLKAVGLGINFALYLLTLFALYRLALRLYGSPEVGAACVLLYGVSVMGISTVMMVRMYMLLTLFTVCLAWVTIAILQEPGKKRLYPLLLLVMLCGMMTQYYFVFYAFFLCAAFAVASLIKRQYKSLGGFALCAAAGVALLFVLYPAAIRHLFVGNGQVVGGDSILEALKDTAGYGERISLFLESSIRIRAIKWVVCGALLCLVPVYLHATLYGTKIDPPLQALIVILPVPLAFLPVAILSPVQEPRYIYNLLPLLVLGVGFLLTLLNRSIERSPWRHGLRIVFLCAIAAAAVWSAKSMPPSTLFTAMPEYDALVAEHSSDPCVYFTGNYYSCITQDLLQLEAFDSFFVTDDAGSAALQDYIGDADEIVLYIDTNARWSSGFDEEDVLEEFARKTGFTESRLLYRYDFEETGGLSVTYVLSRA